MTLSDGRALAGAHIPAGSSPETAKLSPDATPLRAIRRAGISGTVRLP
jgi:hypothetical protein